MTRLALACGLLLGCTTAHGIPDAPSPVTSPEVLSDGRGVVPPTVGASVTGHHPPGPERAHCSASALSAKPTPARPPLPPEVETMRGRIIAAAVACDYTALARLGHEKGEGFSFTFGNGSDAALYWREREAHGDPVLARMVRVLDLPYAHNAGMFAWPSVYQTTPNAADWRLLEGLYPEETLHRWREQNNYLGLRVGIQESGDWLFAVAGD